MDRSTRAGFCGKGERRLRLLGVNAQETQASIDAALTFGILWLDVCRRAQAANVLVEGLKMFVPAGTSALVRERMANLHQDAAKWRLFELDERHDALIEIDCADRGNVATRLVHAADDAAARERFKESIARVQQVLPNCEVSVLSAAEIAFRWRGLEFAQARLGGIPGSFRSTEEIVFGVGAEERILDGSNEAAFTELAHCLRDTRHPYGPRQHPLWRLRPERWLESLVAGDVSVVDDRLEPSCRYSQVPAFSAADRAMIDVLATTRAGRLAVVELKADEDIHLPLQGLDYWSRVEWHHCSRRISPLWIFRRPRVVERETAAVSGGSGVACASGHGYLTSLSFTGD